MYRLRKGEKKLKTTVYDDSSHLMVKSLTTFDTWSSSMKKRGDRLLNLIKNEFEIEFVYNSNIGMLLIYESFFHFGLRFTNWSIYYYWSFEFLLIFYWKIQFNYKKIRYDDTLTIYCFVHYNKLLSNEKRNQFAIAIAIYMLNRFFIRHKTAQIARKIKLKRSTNDAKEKLFNYY